MKQFACMSTLLAITCIVVIADESRDCGGSFYSPEGCTDACLYEAEWEYRPEDESVRFMIKYNFPGDDRWTGIGFTDDSQNLTNIDFIFTWSRLDRFGKRRYNIYDGFIENWGDYAVPDKRMDVYDFDYYSTGISRVFKFTRKRNTTDTAQDMLFSDTECHYFIWADNGGHVGPNYQQQFYEHDPAISLNPLCFRCEDRNITQSSGSTSSQDQSFSTTESINTTREETNTTQTSAIHTDSSSSPSSTQLGSNKNDSDPLNETQFSDFDGSNSIITASSEPRAGQNNKLFSLPEPNWRWLLAIGSMATLLTVVAFKACFVAFNNKKLQKRNLHRQEVLKRNSFLNVEHLEIDPHLRCHYMHECCGHPHIYHDVRQLQQSRPIHPFIAHIN